MRFSIEIRQFSELEMADRGITGTDVAVAVAVDGQIVGYTDDYGTFTSFDRERKVDGSYVEQLVEIAGRVWSSHDFGPQPEPTRWFVVRYDVTREYGGPEEGGWYYDWYESPDVCNSTEDEDLAKNICRELNEQAKREREAEHRPQGRFSVHGGVDHVYIVEKHIGAKTSTVRPHYE